MILFYKHRVPPTASEKALIRKIKNGLEIARSCVMKIVFILE